MTNYKTGDILLLPFPFTDLSSSKKRPALVLSTILSKKLPAIYIVAMITSQIGSENILGDIQPLSWKEAGLLHESKIRLGKLVSVEKSIIDKKLGQLTAKDILLVKKEFKKTFQALL